MPPKIDYTLCIGCGTCIFTCGKSVFTIQPEAGKPYPARAGECVECFMCKVSCQQDAISLAAPFCQATCPAGIDVPLYIDLLGQGYLKAAYNCIKEDLPFPGICGYICHHPCEDYCRRNKLDEPLSIRMLKRYAAEEFMAQSGEALKTLKPGDQKEMVAVVGSGPAGLTAAYYLARLDYNVTVFEAQPVAGGMLALGIPDYRLPKKMLKSEIDGITALGVKIKTGVRIGKDITVKELQAKGYKAVFFALGAHKGLNLKIEGETLDGVVQGLDFLRSLNLGETIDLSGKVVAVIGGGNVAIDAARSAVRLGAAEVKVIYRRRREDMSAYKSEIELSEAEGVKIKCLLAPVKIKGAGKTAAKLECSPVRLGEFDSSGKRNPIVTEEETVSVPADMIIIAAGQVTEALSGALYNDAAGTLMANHETLETPQLGIFAGGDCVTGPDSAISAIASGKKAASAIDRYLGGSGVITAGKPIKHKLSLDITEVLSKAEQAPLLALKDRKGNFLPVELGFSKEQVIEETRRCFRCGGLNRT